MNYDLAKDVMDLVQKFEHANLISKSYAHDVDGFKQWMRRDENDVVLEWEGKELGRTPESIINTLIVHMNRYAKSYSKSAIHGSEFSTQDDFIFLINLKAMGPMTKMELIKINRQEKPVGIKIINRLIVNKWVNQKDSETDKRSKIINITDKGKKALDMQMEEIRKATKIVTGGLDFNEKMQLINLLQKLNDFHQPLYEENLDPSQLVNVAYSEYNKINNNK